ncbi:MAG: hypothetical protein IMY73_04830 [Bacteroidetes bacterium]|nr:hypothetical protein [Bacteroidota bacterium]
MKLKVIRTQYEDKFTIGKLYADDKYLCDTLEDKVRKKGIKIAGETAIPEGEYRLIWNMSNRFKKELPLLLNVPNYCGVRIHCGNTHKDTAGCLLVGKDSHKGYITNSRKTFKSIKEYLQNAESIIIK